MDNRSYLDRFLSLRCSGDVLNATFPIQNFKKEISESMAIIKHLKSIILSNPNQIYHLYDLCAGNALTSVLAVHLFPNVCAYAIDKKKRERKWAMINRFHYYNFDIYDDMSILAKNNEHSIFISVHPCSQLAKRVVEIYNKSNASHLIMMPCCLHGSYKNDIPQIFWNKIGSYLSWCWALSKMCNGKVRLLEDKKCLSPKNCIIVAKKEG